MDSLKVLLVEDDPTLRTIFSRFMESKNMDVISAEDGLQGLNLARQSRPDVIVLDVMLPKMDGYKICHILKSDTRSKEIPIIIYTARAEEKDKSMAEEAGVDRFLVKNDNIPELINTIEELGAKRGEL